MHLFSNMYNLFIMVLLCDVSGAVVTMTFMIDVENYICLVFVYLCKSK